MKNYYIITGASSGIGYALSVYLAQRQKNVVAIARRTSRLTQLQNQFPNNILNITADLSLEDDLNKVTEQISSLEIIGLVNNAGTTAPITSLSKLKKTDWDKQLAINLNAPIFLTQKVLPYLKSKARIINITSMSTKFEAGGIASYAMTKAALNVYSQALSQELKDHEILVAAAHPGLVNTAATDRILRDISHQPITPYLKAIAEEKKFLSTATSAKFLAWLLLTADDKLYKGDIIGIYDKQYHRYWCDEDINFPYVNLIKTVNVKNFKV